MHHAMLLSATLIAAPVLLAQTGAPTPAEQASRMLNLDLARDRTRDAAEDARAADTARATPTPAITDAARQLDADRATNRPDVGRPEESGSTAGTLRTTGEDRNINR
jgi:hypothetical protein